MSGNEHGHLDLDEIRAIVRIASEADISELIVESDRLKVSIRKGAARLAPLPAPPLPAAPDAAVAGPAPAMQQFQPITAPMVGTFYRSAAPDAPAFVDEGDWVEAGQTVCIIEAMKLFNEIASEISGSVAKVLVENGQPVEYGQPLFLIDPREPEGASPARPDA